MPQPSSDKSLEEQWIEMRGNSRLNDIVADIYESIEQDKRRQRKTFWEKIAVTIDIWFPRNSNK